MSAPYTPQRVSQVRDGRIHCPLCDWSTEIPRPQYAPGVAAVFGLDADTLAAIHQRQCEHRMESEIERHLRTHTVTEWTTALMQARDRIAELEARP